VKTLLFVMNPRRITRCIQSIHTLPVDKAWMTGLTEAELPINGFISNTDYDRYSIVSDDGLVTQEAYAHILAAHDTHPEACVTGWCKISDRDPRSNIVSAPLGYPPSLDAYQLMSVEQVNAQPPVFETWFAGYCLTTMSRQLWLDHPHPGSMAMNDYYQSRSLTAAGVPILCARDGYIEHIKAA
jgi:hypothetical protein